MQKTTRQSSHYGAFKPIYTFLFRCDREINRYYSHLLAESDDNRIKLAFTVMQGWQVKGVRQAAWYWSIGGHVIIFEYKTKPGWHDLLKRNNLTEI